MNSVQVAARAYSEQRPQTRSARDLEYDVMLGVTRELKRLHAQNNPPFPNTVAALNKNEKLWTEIGVQVAEEDNALPKDLRARLFYLSEYVSHQTGEVLQGRSTLDSLIETNIAVLRGLKGVV